MRGEQHNPASPSEHVQRMVQDWYYRPGGPPPAGATGWDPLPPNILRCRLSEAWFPCTDGKADELALDEDNVPQPTGRSLTLRDPLGMMAASMLFDEETLSMPSGVCAWVLETYDGTAPADGDGPYYDAINFGQCCQTEEGSGSGSGSEGSGSGSEEGSGSGSGSGSGGVLCYNVPAWMKAIPGYDPNEALGQDLRNVNGCLKWVTPSDCSTGGS